MAASTHDISLEKVTDILTSASSASTAGDDSLPNESLSSMEDASIVLGAAAPTASFCQRHVLQYGSLSEVVWILTNDLC